MLFRSLLLPISLPLPTPPTPSPPSFKPREEKEANAKKPQKSISPGAKSKVKSSTQRGIRAKILEQYPLLEPVIEEIMPKREQLDVVKLCVLFLFFAAHGTGREEEEEEG